MLKVILVLVIFVSSLISSFEQYSIEACSSALGDVALFDLPTRYSPVLLGNKSVVRFGYALPFGIAEFSREYISYNFELLDEQKFYIFMDNFGNDIYRENSLTVAHPVIDEELFQITPSFTYYLLQSGEENYNSASLSLTTYFQLLERIEIVTDVNNLYSLELTDNEKIPVYYNLDIRYRADEKIYIYSGIEKDSKYGAIIKSGIEYRALEYLNLLGGYNFNPEKFSSGFEINFNSFRFCYSFSYHSVLDFSHFAGLSYEL